MLVVSLLVCLSVGAVEEDAGVVGAEAGPTASEAEPAGVDAWWAGDHLTGEWGGAREWLGKHGVTIDFVYAGEVFANASKPEPGENGSYTGHFDLALTLDSEGLGLWPGTKLYVLGQNNHGPGINEYVGSVTEISNIESRPYFQLGEFFLEQSIFDKVRIRLGKQDANRDFGTPRFGGNFINNNFGMLPSAPLPSYPTNGLGAVVLVQPTWWLLLKGAFYEGKPQIGSVGFDTAFAPNAGHFAVAGVAVMHRYGAEDRNNGTTSLTGYRQQGEFTEFTDDAMSLPRTFSESWGFFAQNDERIYLNPADENDPRCFTFITRIGWSQPDRNLMPLFFSASLAYHGIGTRQDDTIGVGVGGFAVSRMAGGTPGRGAEYFAEIFYKWRLTKFMSLQPDLQFYRTPGGDLPDALIVGTRLKFKL